jgi:SAM-dependent methyltransferase
MSISNASEHYLGQQGEQYFAWQRNIGILGAQLNLYKFQPHIRPTDTVLDFGCGGGYLLAALNCAARTGVEMNPAAAAIASGQGVNCVAALRQVPDASVDAVISNHALEHTLSPLQELREIRAKLKPTGRAVLIIPVDDWRNQRVYNPADVNHHLFTWTPQLFGHLLAEAGFQVAPGDITIERCAWPPHYATLSRVLPQWAFRTLCSGYSVLARRRELKAIVRPK